MFEFEIFKFEKNMKNFLIMEILWIMEMTQYL